MYSKVYIQKKYTENKFYGFTGCVSVPRRGQNSKGTYSSPIYAVVCTRK